MKIGTKSIKIIAMIFLTLLILFGTTAGTMAYLSGQTGDVSNTFLVGSVESEISEDISSYGTKNVRIVNTGKNDCLVRVRYAITPENVEGVHITGLNVGNTPGSWSYQTSDGFYYYNGIVPAKGNHSTYFYTSSLFSGYSIDGVDAQGKLEEGTVIPDFDIVIYQESVQAEVTGPDGTILRAYDANGNYDARMAAQIWEFYDQGE